MKKNNKTVDEFIKSPEFGIEGYGGSGTKVRRFSVGGELKYIPNQQGYQFIGITHEGNEIDCIVKRDSGGMYRAYDMFGARVLTSLRAWRRHDKY